MTDRTPIEAIWARIVRYVMPMGPRFEAYGARHLIAYGEKIWNTPTSSERSPELYDSTSVWAINRLATGVESIITPKTSFWHDLGIDDPLAGEASDDELNWFDLYRQHLFAVRYDPRSGFMIANQKAIRSACALGTGVFMVEDKFGVVKDLERKVPMTYRHIPLSEAFIIVDYRGVPIGLHRVYTMTCEQALAFFGDKCPGEIKDKAEDPERCMERMTFVHAVEKAHGNDRHNLMPWVSMHYCLENKQFIHRGGYNDFPFVVYYWEQDENSAYGQSPVMMALSEIQVLNLLSKHSSRAMQQWTDPPLAAMADDIVNQPNLNPSKINYGYLDEDTFNVKLKPIITAQNPSFVEVILNSKREQLKESLYITLWQTLIQNREMTATESLIRANEKGELLGPVGDGIQTGLASMFNREHAILARKGAFDRGSALAPPDSIRGKSFGPKFISTYDRMRRSPELIGIERVIGTANALLPIFPNIKYRLDENFILRHVQMIGGAPARTLRSKDDADADIQMAEQAQQAAGMAAIAEQGGKAANEILPAIQQAQNQGLLPAPPNSAAGRSV